MAFRSPNINVMEGAARKAARGLIRDFNEVENLQVSKKGPADFVSQADTKAEKILREELQKARPKYGLLLEEGGEIIGEDKTHRWIVDPLDGTTNFLHGLPHWAISIGLEHKGEMIAGVVYDPVKDELFWAEKGVGAFVNARRLRVSARTRLEQALVATGIPFLGHGDHARFQAEFAALSPQVAGIRRWGAASLDLAYVAAGRFDGFWETGLAPWDMAAGVLLVREAGGMVTQTDGREHQLGSPTILAAADGLHMPLAKVLGAVRTQA